MVSGGVWYVLYRDPVGADRVVEVDGAAERADRSEPAARTPFCWADLWEVFSHRKLWGIYIGQFAVTSVLWFFLTWFPIYLQKYRGINLVKTGFLAAIPFLAAFCGILLSGFLSDFLVKKKVSPEIARKLPVVAGLLLSMSIVGANYVHSTWLVILFMAIAFFGNGVASITWVFVSLLSPKRLVGMTSGAFNFIGSLSSVSVPFIIGYLVRNGDFKPALLFISLLALLGIGSYVFLVGKITSVETIPVWKK